MRGGRDDKNAYFPLVGLSEVPISYFLAKGFFSGTEESGRGAYGVSGAA
jgi:hypothetical protein